MDLHLILWMIGTVGPPKRGKKYDVGWQMPMWFIDCGGGHQEVPI